jgi:hypothetical protein
VTLESDITGDIALAAVHHFDLLNHSAIYARLRDWLG